MNAPATPCTPFVFARAPEIHFGPGLLARLPKLIRLRARRALLITGAASFRASPRHAHLMQALAEAGVAVEQAALTGEPSPAFVDATAERCRAQGIDCVVAIGGGSAIDAGKAISAMLPQQGSVTDFLECFERRQHDGRKVPFIAVPTSSGTGAEATKNAVLSTVGRDGYKSSLRHDNLVPDVALVDPELMLSCPPAVTAACGMDALTQLLEAYVSSKASPLTDALALSGLEHVAAGFLAAVEDGDTDLAARSHMAYAALLSGMALANAGLGLVHGYAGPLGAYHPVPHGVVCGTLVGAATRATLAALWQDPERHAVALRKYARAGSVLAQTPTLSLQADGERLLATLDDWIARSGIPRLGAYGVGAADLPAILDKTNGKNSPVTLSREGMEAILLSRL